MLVNPQPHLIANLYNGWRGALQELNVLPKNTTQCRWQGHEPGPFNQEYSFLSLLIIENVCMKAVKIIIANLCRSQFDPQGM